MKKKISQIDDSNADNFDTKRKNFLENELDELYNSKAKGAQIRSKAKWINDGEKNTKCFLGLEKSHQTSNVIKELKVDNDNTVKTDNEILVKCVAIMKLYINRKIKMIVKLIIILVTAIYRN